MSDEEILELGEPILKITENTVKYDKKTLRKLSEVTRPLSVNSKTISKAEYKEIVDQTRKLINSSESNFEYRNFEADDVRGALIELNGGGGSATRCNTYFNVQGTTVYLFSGDNFDHANDTCPAGYTFNIMQGTHYGHTITDSKDGNTWTGVNAILDGQGSTKRAFKDGLDDNTISWLEIRNYSRHGIKSNNSENVFMTFLTFSNIAPTYCNDPNNCGQYVSAIRFDNSQSLYIQSNDFENVATSIRIQGSNGPIVVQYNEALNSGRNFFQLSGSSGGGIKVHRNSMERTAQYGNKVLEDWINIYDSEGTSSSWIEVTDNRARGHSNSNSGSFIILGDASGQYQTASENIGVNPGQIGIGAAGGNDIEVKDNKMYSKGDWAYSNTGFYSAPYSPPCGNHDFPSNPENKSNWICGSSTSCSDGSNNYAWAPHPDSTNCGIDFYQIRANVDKDTSLDEDIWNDW